MTSGHASRINRPNTWCSDQTWDVKKALANTEPSTHGRFCCRKGRLRRGGSKRHGWLLIAPM